MRLIRLGSVMKPITHLSLVLEVGLGRRVSFSALALGLVRQKLPSELASKVPLSLVRSDCVLKSCSFRACQYFSMTSNAAFSALL